MLYTSIGISEELKLKLMMLKLVERKKSMEELLNDMLEVYEKSKEENNGEETKEIV